MPESLRPVRSVRHWKQQFRKGGPFRWRRPTVFAGVRYEAGEVVPDGLLSPTKARRFWRSLRIEMAEFVAPDVLSGVVPSAAPPVPPAAPGPAPRARGRGRSGAAA